ncbi:MAG: RibD family protein [Rhodospirillum sp.]|nr:RibD family protein [Rhodospirillum sp.]MCF8491048.1 RibD family protein [Rhodospirillum sp.]MCF8500371.1 RibD family protein [Rhodospirillum sp.]
MRMIDVTDSTWAKLLALRDGLSSVESGGDPAMRVYAPIAGAKGPFVLAQVGQSLDGRIATPTGDARDVSGSDGLAHLHRCRALVDAVIVGVTTVTSDDPRLSVRMVHGPDPVRVVIDCHGVLTGKERLFHDDGAPVIVFQSWAAPTDTLANAEVIRLDDTNGLSPGAILTALAELGLRRVLVEGGARTIARFVDAGHVDRLHVTVSPIIIGSGPNGISLAPIDRLSDAKRPVTRVYSLGSDILFDCRLR